jgi:WD40 repeat protein
MPQFLSVLPANLVVYIFQFLPLRDLCSVSAVCSYWRAAAAADVLWEAKCKHEWPRLESRKGNRWKDVYVFCGFVFCLVVSFLVLFGSYVQGIHASSWKGAGKMTLDTLRGHGKAVLAVDACGDRLVSGGEDKKIRVWSAAKRRCLTTLRGHGKSVVAVRLAGEANLAVSGGAEGSVRVWELTKGKCVKTLEHKGVSCVDVLPGGRVACSAGCDSVVRMWDLETGALSSSFGCGSGVLCVRLDGPQKAFWGCMVTRMREGDFIVIVFFFRMGLFGLETCVRRARR